MDLIEIEIGKVYTDGNRTFLAVIKDAWNVYDSTGWMYSANNLQEVKQQFNK